MKRCESRVRDLDVDNLVWQVSPAIGNQLRIADVVPDEVIGAERDVLLPLLQVVHAEDRLVAPFKDQIGMVRPKAFVRDS